MSDVWARIVVFIIIATVVIICFVTAVIVAIAFLICWLLFLVMLCNSNCANTDLHNITLRSNN